MSGGRVLVVDDTEFNRRLLVRLLASIGHQASEAADGRQALELLRDPGAGPVDVVLLDIVMPEMDGYEMLAELKADPDLRDLPVIVDLRRRRARQRRALHPDGRRGLPAQERGPGILRARIDASLAQKRLRDLERASLEQQLAVNEVLRIMTRSAFDLQVVLDSLVAAAARLCGADYGAAYIAEDAVFRVVASHGASAELDADERTHFIPAGRGTLVGRVALTGAAAQIEDVLADPDYVGTPGGVPGGARTLLGVPILQDSDVIGVLALTRRVVGPFDEAARRLAAAFADQAAIGIGNARLLETIERQRAQLSRFLSPQVAALVSSRDGELLLAGHRARSRPSSATCATSPCSRRRRSRRRSWASCAPTTLRWASSSSSAKAPSSTSRATGS